MSGKEGDATRGRIAGKTDRCRLVRESRRRVTFSEGHRNARVDGFSSRFRDETEFRELCAAAASEAGNTKGGAKSAFSIRRDSVIRGGFLARGAQAFNMEPILEGRLSKRDRLDISSQGGQLMTR